ncbi:hypothetical protein QJQ45_000534 [Haematococcus lacustris]|nr:hypothetical protein QJQ45_000534 [Haematococcus lacustris]
MLRHYISPAQSDWPFFLSLAEFAVNNSWQESIQSTPFLVNTGQSPLTPALLELPGEVYCPSARKLSEWWQSNVKQARHFMEQAQQRQAYLANKGRRDVEFSPGQLVLLSTKNLRLKPGKAKKLLPGFIGPFKVLEHVGPVAVRLDLPPAMARMHPVFHVALLRPYTSEHPHLPPPVDWLDEAPLYEVEKLLAHRGVRAGRARGYLIRAAEQAERQLEAQQRRGDRRPVAQPAPRADTVDQLAVGVQWASRVRRGPCPLSTSLVYILKGTAAPGSSACRFCQPGHLEILTHAFLTCTAVAPDWEWVLDVNGHLTGTRPPSGDAMLLLSGRPTRGEAPPFQPPDNLLWLRLRVAYMGAVWRLRSSGAATALQPHQVARRVVEEVISTLTTAVKRDWHRVTRDIRVGLCGAVPSTWFKGKDPELDAAHFDQLWPEASGGPNNSRLYHSKAICVMPRGEGGVGLPDLGVTSTAMLAKMLAQLWSPRVRPWQPLIHSLLADPSHGLSTWVITDPTAPPARGISPRLQAHVAALAELKLFRAVPPAGQSFFSVLAEPLWYNAQVRINPAAREAAAEQGWTHVRHVREALHSPELEGEARWAADLVRACLPEPWQGMVDRLQPPQPEWERLRVGPGVGFVLRRTFMLQPSHWIRAAEQAERQLEAQQRRGDRRPVAQPAPRADTVDQLAVGVQRASRVRRGPCPLSTSLVYILKGTAAPGSSACRFCQPGHLEILTHAFLTCTAVAPAWEWVLDVYGHLTGTRPPSGDAMLLLSGRPTRGEVPPFQPPDNLLWLRLRVAYMGAVWRLRSSGAATALQPHQVARRVVEEVISTLTTAVKRNWHRVGRDIRVGLCGAVPSTWFKGKDPELDAAHFDQLWPEASGGPNSSRLYPSKAICVMPRGEGGVGLPDLGVTSTAMLAKMLAQLWSPRVRPWQPLIHSLLADPSHGLSTWVITDPTAPPARGISPRLQAHVAALAELKLYRAVPPAGQSFFSVLAEPLWYSAQVRINPAAREAAAEQGWTHVRHVREALHSPELEGEARWAADLVRACLPEPWQGMVDRLQPPQPEWERLRVGPGVGFVMRRTFMLQPSHWIRAAEQAERQLEAQQRRGDRRPVAQPAPRADTVDQLAVGVQRASRVRRGPCPLSTSLVYILKGTAAPGSSACRFCQPGHLEILTHAFLTCTAVAPAWEWVLDVYGHLTGTRPPSGDAMLLLSGRPTRGEAPPFQPPDNLLWLRLRVAYMGAVWRLRSSGAATALQPHQVARRVVEEVISTLTTAVKRDWHRERSPNSSRLYPSKAICVMPRGEGGVGLPDLGVTSTAMLAKMLAQLWSPRVRPWQPLIHSLLADPSHGLSTWVITDPTAPPARGISPRLQAHVAALAELKLFRAVPPAGQSFFSVLAEPLWYNAQVRINPAAREAAAEQGWTHVRHVREALHSPELEGEARWAADLVRACLPEPWQGMVDRLQPPQPEWERLRVGPGVGFVLRRTFMLQPSHWEEWLLGPWAHLLLDPQVWGMGTTTLLDFSVKHARVRLHQLQRVSADPLYPPGGGLWPALWGVRPARAAGEPEVAAVADGALRELELKWEASVQHVAGQGAAGEREQQGRDVEERLPEEVQGSQPPRWLDTSARAHQRPSPQMRAAQQAERQLEAPQRRGGRQLVAQPAPRADTADQLAVGVQAGQPCAKVWKELLDPTLRREHVIVAWRVLHASLMVGALWGHILKGTAAPGSSACRFCQPGHLETLTHAFLTCPAVVPAWEWVLDVYSRLTGTRPPSGDAMLLLSGRPTRGEAPPFQPPDSLLWLRLRVAYLGAVWRLRSSGAATALQPQQVARRVVEEVISTLTTAVKRDWHRIRAAEQAERQLEAQQRRGDRRPVAQPAPRADTVDQLAVGVQRASRVRRGPCPLSTSLVYILKGTAAPGSSACRFCQPGHLEILTHAFLTCTAVAPDWEWVLDVYGHLTSTRSPSGDAMLLLSGRPTRGEAPPFQPPDNLLWLRLRVAYMGAVWRLRSSGAATALQPHQVARRVVEEVISTLTTAVKRDWHRVGRDIRVGLCGAVPSTWFKGKDPELDAAHFDQLWPEASGGPNSSRLYPSKAICVMPRGEGGVGLPDLGVTSTAMLAKMLAQLWSPRVRPWQPLIHSLLADPSHGLSTWVITDPTAPPARGISPRLQAHVAALAELKLFRAVPPAGQSFFSVLAEPLWYSAQVRINPAAREAAAEQGWTHVRHVREALHSPELEGEARWAADLVRACLPEPWQGMVDRLQPPQPEWERLRVGPGVGFVLRRTFMLQPSHWIRAAEQAERQLEAQQRRGDRRPVAQPAPRADTVDQLAVGVQRASRVRRGPCPLSTSLVYILKGTAAPGSSACRFCQPGHLEILTHAFLTCTAVAPAWEWVLDVYGHLTGTRPPSGDAMLLLSGRPTRGEAPPFQPPDNLLWLRLRVAYMGAVWRLRSSGAATALQPHQVARRVVEEVISTLTTAVKRDWHRVGRDIRVGLCGAVPSTWFKGIDPELDAAHFDQLWPEASGGWFAKQPRRERRGGQEEWSSQAA